MNNELKIFIIVLICLIIGFTAGYLLKPVNTLKETENVTTIRRDTLFVEKYYPEYKKIKEAVVVFDTTYKTDTMIVTKPFIASVKDTVFSRDTLDLRYHFPKNVFEIGIKKGADSIRVITQWMPIKEYEKLEWWERPVMITGGIVVGILVGGLK